MRIKQEARLKNRGGNRRLLTHLLNPQSRAEGKMSQGKCENLEDVKRTKVSLNYYFTFEKYRMMQTY